MEQRYVGRSGLQVSDLGLGTLTWGAETDEHDARDQLKAFVGCGGTLVDTGDAYSGGASEAVLGSLLGDVALREEVVLCVTAGPSPAPAAAGLSLGGGVADPRLGPDVSARALLSSLDRSLARLGTDHVDLWCVPGWNPAVPVDEVVSATATAVTSGRVRYVGLGDHAGWQVATVASAARRAGVPVVVAAAEYSLLHRSVESELVPAAAHHGVGLLARSPLAHGVLTAKYRTAVPPRTRGDDPARAAHVERGLGQRGRRIVQALTTAADGLDAEPWEVAISWVRDAPGVTSVLLGARTSDQLTSLLAADDLVMPPEIRGALAEVAL